MAATHRFRSFDAEVNDGLITVSGKVALMDQRGKNSYIWRLSFLDAGGNPVGQILYDQQVFGLKPGVSMEPTFREVTAVPEGARMVQLSLFSFAPGTDTTLFADHEKSNGYLILRKVKSF